MTGCCCRTCPGERNGYTIVLTLLGVLRAFVVGLILGVTYTATLTPALTVLIAAAAGLAVLFVLFLILRYANGRRTV